MFKIKKNSTYSLLIFVFGCVCGSFIKGISQAELRSADFSSSNEVFSCNDKTKFPKILPVIERSGYSISYDCRTKNANWVYEKITAESICGNENRNNFQFKEDHEIPKIFQSKLGDFKDSGFDRGHLAPAANHKNNKESLANTFYLSNISPQVPQFNRGYWAKLEKHIRELTKHFDVVHIITGPLFLPEEENDGKKYVKYQVIGKNDVAVPTHFFKVIILENLSGEQDRYAYILPNTPISSNSRLEQFLVTTQKVEKLAGLMFPQ